jgi:3-oxoadipate enol-lactonase
MIPMLSLSEPVGPTAAPLLVLGPSLGTSSELWAGASGILNNSFRVAVWDLPGHGESPAASRSFSTGEIADAVIAAVDSMGENRVFYAGVSLGGAIGLEMATRHPGRLHAVSVICSGAVIGTREGWNERAAAVRRDGTSSLVRTSADRWFAPSSRLRNPEVTERLLAGLPKVDSESYALCCEALARYDLRDGLGTVALPLQAIWAEHDAVTPKASSYEIRDLVQDAEVVEVKGAGHLAPAERPSEVADLMSDFFAMRVAA